MPNSAHLVTVLAEDAINKAVADFLKKNEAALKKKREASA